MHGAAATREHDLAPNIAGAKVQEPGPQHRSSAWEPPGPGDFTSRLRPIALGLPRVMLGLGANSALPMGQGAESGTHLTL